MRLSRAGYLADFYVYPLVGAALGASAAAPSPRHWGLIAGAFIAGLAAWTLLEYTLHRWVMHRAPWIRSWHEEHHRDPRAYVGTPTWLSILALGAMVLLPTVILCGRAGGSSFTAGVAVGYLAYVAAHYAAHHMHFASVTLLARLKRRHAIHHHSEAAANFGVTTPIWDHVFATALARDRRDSAETRPPDSITDP